MTKKFWGGMPPDPPKRLCACGFAPLLMSQVHFCPPLNTFLNEGLVSIRSILLPSRFHTQIYTHSSYLI